MKFARPSVLCYKGLFVGCVLEACQGYHPACLTKRSVEIQAAAFMKVTFGLFFLRKRHETF